MRAPRWVLRALGVRSPTAVFALEGERLTALVLRDLVETLEAIDAILERDPEDGR